MMKYRWWIVAAVISGLVLLAGLFGGGTWPELAFGGVLDFLTIRLVFWLLSKVLNFGKSAVQSLTGSAPKS